MAQWIEKSGVGAPGPPGPGPTPTVLEIVFSGSQASVGVPYSGSLTATGGILPYVYSIFSGSLPPGISLDSASGLLHGTPTTAGAYSFVGQVQDEAPNVATVSCTITVVAALPLEPLSVTIAETPGSRRLRIADNQTICTINVSGTLPSNSGATNINLWYQSAPSGVCHTNNFDVYADRGSAFNASMTTININGTNYSFTVDPLSTIHGTLGTSAGVQNNVPWFATQAVWIAIVQGFTVSGTSFSYQVDPVLVYGQNYRVAVSTGNAVGGNWDESQWTLSNQLLLPLSSPSALIVHDASVIAFTKHVADPTTGTSAFWEALVQCTINADPAYFLATLDVAHANSADSAIDASYGVSTYHFANVEATQGVGLVTFFNIRSWPFPPPGDPFPKFRLKIQVINQGPFNQLTSNGATYTVGTDQQCWDNGSGANTSTELGLDPTSSAIQSLPPVNRAGLQVSSGLKISGNTIQTRNGNGLSVDGTGSNFVKTATGTTIDGSGNVVASYNPSFGISVNVSGQLVAKAGTASGITFDVSGNIAALADGTTIAFDGSGRMYVKSLAVQFITGWQGQNVNVGTGFNFQTTQGNIFIGAVGSQPVIQMPNSGLVTLGGVTVGNGLTVNTVAATFNAGISTNVITISDGSSPANGIFFGGLIRGTSYYVGSTQVINSSAQFVGAGVNCPAYVVNANSYQQNSTTIVDAFRNASFTTVQIAGTTVIDGSRNVIGASFYIGANQVIDGSRNGTFQTLKANLDMYIFGACRFASQSSPAKTWPAGGSSVANYIPVYDPTSATYMGAIGLL